MPRVASLAWGIAHAAKSPVGALLLSVHVSRAWARSARVPSAKGARTETTRAGAGRRRTHRRRTRVRSAPAGRGHVPIVWGRPLLGALGHNVIAIAIGIPRRWLSRVTEGVRRRRPHLPWVSPPTAGSVVCPV